jgi:hypothetical protein
VRGGRRRQKWRQVFSNFICVSKKHWKPGLAYLLPVVSVKVVVMIF